MKKTEGWHFKILLFILLTNSIQLTYMARLTQEWTHKKNVHVAIRLDYVLKNYKPET